MAATDPRPLSYYAHEVRRDLPDEVFHPAPARLLWLPVHLAVIAAGIWVIASGTGGWPVAALMTIPLGLAFAGMAFVAHETLHGATTRRPLVRRLLGWLGFMPFAISPRHWVAWHNRMHHGNTMHPVADPDAYPTIERYQRSRRARAADRISFGGHRLFGLATLLLGLCGQSAGVLLGSGPRAGYLSRRQYLLALAETGAALAVWIGLGVIFGAGVFFFGWLLPLAAANVVLMAHILTNHSLSRMTEVNDPLVNSLTVTVPGWVERYTLQFGMHVEHHLFPSVSGRHAAKIRALLERRWPDRYRSLPMFEALRMLFRSGRVYKDPGTLIDPRTGRESAAL